MNIFLFIVLITGDDSAVLKYFDSQGNALNQPDKNRNFIAFFTYQSYKLYFRSTEHPYFTNLSLFEDPCESRIDGLFNSAKGVYNFCENKLEFVYMNSYYTMNTVKDNNNLEILPLSNAPSKFKEKVYNDQNSTSDSLDLINEPSEAYHLNPILEKNSFKIKIFVFNSEERAKRLGKDIVVNTDTIFEYINSIFRESNIPLTVEIAGILNFNHENISNGSKSLLESFKDLIEPTRFSHFNFKKPLARSDLTLLIFEKKDKPYLKEHLKVHGMTYMGGSSRLDSSYSTVITSEEDTEYFIAKKIAHEIGHSLNAKHTSDESIMEKTTCKDCTQSKRLFSEASKEEIMKFLTKNSKIFSKKWEKKYIDDDLLKNKKEANEYASERRKHTFQDIVKTRLHNRKPSFLAEGPNPFFILFLYSVLLLLVFYYWK